MAITATTVGLNEVTEMLNTMPNHLFDKAKKEVQRSTLDAQSSITKPMKTGLNGLQSRSGNLARSIQTSVTGSNLNNLKGSVFTKSIYAPIHEKGGTINAKNAYTSLAGGPFLNIPSSQNRTPAGIMRNTAKEVFSQGGYIVKINAPKARYMVALNGTPMFWLVNNVYIKARLKMVKQAVDEIPTLLSNLNTVLLQGV